LKPSPDVYLGNPSRAVFLEAIRRTSLSVTVSIAPYLLRHEFYFKWAKRNRNWKKPWFSETPSAENPEPGPDGDLCSRASLAALKTVSLPWWAERGDLINEGCCAILQSRAKDEALARTVAYRAMVDYLRRGEVRQRDREWSSGEDEEPDGILDGERSYNVRQSGEPRVARRYNPKQPGVAGRDAALWEAIKALPVRQRTAIQLQVSAGCSNEEIAQRMVTSTKSVEGLLARARKSIKEFSSTAGDLSEAKRLYK